MEDPKEILKRIRELELRTNRLVNTAFAGQYHSVFKGHGMNFEEVREYQAGDEIRAIDWNVTARMGQPFIKKFTEERELSVVIMLDLSASGDYGTADMSKRRLAAEVSSILLFSAIRNNDKTGLIIFTDEVELYIPPKKGRLHALRIMREMLFFEPRSRRTDIAAALDFLNHVMHRRSVVFLVSDFESPDFKRPLSVSATRHDLIALPIRDPSEYQLPDLGKILIEDAETGEQVEMNTGSSAARNAFRALTQRRHEKLKHFFRQNRIDSIDLRTDEDYLPALRTFFKQRERRLAHA